MARRTIKALAAAAGALAAAPALAQTPAGRPDYWHHGWEWGWGGMLFGSFMMILFWGAIILVIVLAIRWLSGGSSPGLGLQAPNRRALDILHERFARGEIDREEFEERKRLLSE